MRIVFDLEAKGFLTPALDFTKFPLKLKPEFQEYLHCLVAKDIDTGKVYKFRPKDRHKIAEFFSKVTMVIGHNIICYDLLALEIEFGLKFKLDPSTINGKPVEIFDTLVWSRVLNPDRIGGHSLEAWGKKLGILKGQFGKTTDWMVFTEDMLEYCVQDVEVSEAIYYAILEEIGDWPWQDAYNTEAFTAYITERQSYFGFYFDKDLAERNLEWLNKELDRLEKAVEPLLPTRTISATDQKKYTPPKVQFLKSGKPSKNLEKFVERMGGELTGPREVVIDGVEYTLPLPQKPLKTQAPMQMSNQADMKEWLVEIGWEPTVWGEKDLTLDDKTKRKVSKDKFIERVQRYVAQTRKSNFAKYRCEKLRCSLVELEVKLLNHDMKRPLKVFTSPKYTVDADKNLCPSLINLGKKVEFVEKVVMWLTYRHRRNSILGQSGKGFLTEILDNGRIRTPAISCGASTSRYKHSVVCNIPRVTSVFGAEIRGMFGCFPENWQCGYDFSGLEARIEGHYTRQFKGGDEYSKMLVAEKPNDIHTVMAKLNNITRDEQKSLKYGLTYGAQVPKVSKMFAWPMWRAQEVFESFWENASPLKTLKERVTKYWKTIGGKKFVKGLDGRKLWVRSEHSILNIIFQSAGVICAKKANELHWKKMEKLGILFDPFTDESFKGKCFMQIHYHKVVVAS